MMMPPTIVPTVLKVDAQGYDDEVLRSLSEADVILNTADAVENKHKVFFPFSSPLASSRLSNSRPIFSAKPSFKWIQLETQDVRPDDQLVLYGSSRNDTFFYGELSAKMVSKGKVGSEQEYEECFCVVNTAGLGFIDCVWAAK